MLAEKTIELLSINEYLSGESISDIRHELINGEVYAMSGAKVAHNRLTMTFAYKLKDYIENHSETHKTYDIFTSDMKVRIGDNFYYPDVVVTCEEDLSLDALYTEKPLVIIEVLSKSTRKIDHNIKRTDYTRIPSLEEYILVEQDIAEIEIVRKSQGWKPQYYFLGDDLLIESLNCSLSVESIYQRVNNEDMKDFLNANLALETAVKDKAG